MQQEMLYPSRKANYRPNEDVAAISLTAAVAIVMAVLSTIPSSAVSSESNIAKADLGARRVTPAHESGDDV